jgi:hypothetical protein
MRPFTTATVWALRDPCVKGEVPSSLHYWEVVELLVSRA